VLTRLVGEIRSLGAVGVGQSSWGPTLYVVQPNQSAAESLARSIADRHTAEKLDITITPSANRGARIDVER
jgi:predicted sugar kinase